MQKKALREAWRLSDEAWRDQTSWEQNTNAAIALLESELKETPNSTDVMISLGALLSDSGKHRQALNILREAEANGSEDTKLYYNIGAALMNLGVESRIVEKEYFEKSARMKANPETIRAYFDPQAH